MFPPARVVYSSVFFVLVMALVVLTKPSLMFAEDGQVRPFGFRASDPPPSASAPAPTPLPLGAVAVAVAVGSMLLFGTIDVIYKGGGGSGSGASPPMLEPMRSM